MIKNWNEVADVAQSSLDYFYKADDIQFLNNFYPLESKDDNKVFNYWWLAHTVDVRLDGYLRTNDEKFLQLAEETYAYNKNRNGKTLKHDYYDDMLWNALAAYRLYKSTKNENYLQDAIFVWNDLVETGWNDTCNGGFAWKRPQMYYKNTPVNAPFIILSTWLYQELKEEKYLSWAHKTFTWLVETLLREDEFVEDGINRLEDGKIDTQWEFTYNQGVYIGSCIELFKITEDEQYLEKAVKNARVTIERLSDGKVFHDEGEGGDEGLFKGIFYRYFTQLIEITNNHDFKKFLEEGTEILIKNAEKENHLLMGMDWYKPTEGKIPFSAQLSGMMAIEMAAKLN